jgi:hypothetical protein
MSVVGHLGHLAAWAVGVSAVLLSTLVLLRVLDVRGALPMLLATAVLGPAQMVLAIEALSPAGLIGLWPLLVFHVAVAVVLLACGLRPARVSPREVRESVLRATPGVPLRLLLAATALAAIALLALVCRVPPNNQDGLTYHMTRVAVFLQHGTLDAWAAPDLRLTVMPANAELLILWQVALLRHDLTAGLVQWMSWVGTMLAVFGIGREAGLPRARAAFGALAFGALPAAVLQATSVQNDLTTAFFVAVALFFGSRALDVGVPGALLAGASFGLALGTKPTAALALPAFALFLAARVRSRGGPWPWRRLGQLCASGALGVALLGSYVYVQNVRRFGSPSGPPVFRDLMSPSRPSPRDLWSNGARLALRLLDPAGSVPPDTRAASWLVRGYGRVQDEWFRRLSVAPSIPADFQGVGWRRFDGLRPHEDLALFGPLYGAVLLLGATWALVRSRGDPRMRALGAGTLLYLAGIATVFRYQQFHGRLLLTAAAIGGPLLGIAFRDRPGWARQASNLLLASACVSALVACVLYNDRKPFFGPSSVWATGDRVSRMRTGQPGLDATLRLLERLPPGRLAVLPLQPDAASYPYFGRHLDRPVTLIHAGHLASLSAAALPEADYLLAAADLQYVYVEGERPAAPASPWVDVLDLSLLRRELRGGASGWLTLFDAEVLGDPLVLFAHRFDRATAAAGRPGVLNPQPEPYPDGWAHPVFRIPVLLDQARRVLVVSGDPLPSALPVRLVASLPSGETLARFETAREGRFTMRVPLDDAHAITSALYIQVTITTTHGEDRARRARGDPRDLSWAFPRFELQAGD